MKLKIDAIEAKGLPLTMNGEPTLQPVLKIVAGEFEATTSRVDNDNDFNFPEAFQLEVDQDEYASGELLLEVEVYDFSTGDYVYVGKGSAVLASLLPTIDIALHFQIELTAYDPRYEGPRPGQVHMRGVVSSKDPLEEELALKQQELEQVKRSFDEYVASAKELEGEMENALQMATTKIQKLSAKTTTVTEKYNELTETYNSLTDELTRLQEENDELRQKSHSTTTISSEYLSINQSLTMQISSLTMNLSRVEAEKAAVQAEVDDLYTTKYAKYEEELKMKYQLEQLTTQNEALVSSAGDSSMIQDLSSRLEAERAAQREAVQAHEQALAELKAHLASAAITVKSTLVTNTQISNTVVNSAYFETIINSSSETNVFITNVMRSGNADKLKEALIHQLVLYDEMKGKNFKLLGKILTLQSSVVVCARVRPPTPTETEAGGKLCVDPKEGAVFLYDQRTEEWGEYELDAVWGYDHTQADVFADIEPMIGALCGGKSGCVLALGESGAGSTFTMSGFGAYLGANYRALLKTFEMLDLMKKTSHEGQDAKNPAGGLTFSVDVGLVYVREDVVYDLLSAKEAALDTGSGRSLAVTIKKAPKYTKLTLKASRDNKDKDKEDNWGMTLVVAGSASEAMQVLAKAVMVAALDSGADSSALPAGSHLILQIGVTVTKDEASLPVRATLRMADLAASDTKFPSSHVRNLGMGALKTVVGALAGLAAQGDNATASATDDAKVPYSQSQLTTLLRPSLLGKTMLIVTLAPTHLSYTQSQEGLQLATVARGVKVDVSRQISPADLKNLETKVRNAKGEAAEAQRKYGLIEQVCEETKAAAEALVTELNSHCDELITKYEEEKDHSHVLQGDLETGQRNMKRTLDQLKDQLVINERLMGVIKRMDEEKREDEGEGVQTQQ